jgi:hypothetical protein
MFNSKAIRVLQTLSPAERRRFKKWVQSPIHNSNERLSTLYYYIEQKNEWTARSLNKEKAFAAILPETPYDDQIMRRVLSEFLALIKAFLAHESIRERRTDDHLILSKIYRDRQLHAEAEAELLMADEQLKAQPLRDAAYYLDAYRLQEERFLQIATRDKATNVQALADELSRFFAAEILRTACVAASHQAMYKTHYTMPYLELVLEDCSQGRYDEVPVILVYYHSYCCLTQVADATHFFHLKPMLEGADKWLPLNELRQVFLFGINYCIRRVNTDDTSFMKEVFDLYHLGLKQDVFMENGFLSRFTFKNIVAAALQLKEMEWTEAFITDYSPCLHVQFRDTYERFCRAKLCYERKDYDQVQSLLFNVAFDDIFLDLSARALLLKTYFETAEWRLLEGYVKTFEQFVRRKKSLGYHGPNYLNLIHFTQRLMLWRSGKKVFGKAELSLMREQIEAARPLTERVWLLGQCMADSLLSEQDVTQNLN